MSREALVARRDFYRAQMKRFTLEFLRVQKELEVLDAQPPVEDEEPAAKKRTRALTKKEKRAARIASGLEETRRRNRAPLLEKLRWFNTPGPRVPG